MARNHLFLLIICGYFFVSNARAQEVVGDDKFEESQAAPQEEVSLNTYEEKLKRWQGLTEEQRQVIRDRARKISPEQINEFRQRQEEFRKLPPLDRERIKNNYRKFRQIPPDKRRVLEERYQRFRKLPEEQRIELRRKILERRQLPGAQNIKARQLENVSLPQQQGEEQARVLTHPRLREYRRKYRQEKQGIVPEQHSKREVLIERRHNANLLEQRREKSSLLKQKTQAGNNRLRNYQQKQIECKEGYKSKVNRFNRNASRRFAPQRSRKR